MQIFAPRKRSCGKVMFSRVSVCHCVGGPHVTITHNPMDLTVQDSPPPPSSNPSSLRHQTWRPLELAPPASDIWWPSLEICSSLSLVTPLTVLTSGGQSTYSYSWQEGGTHPTGMLSCLMYVCTERGIIHVGV